MFHACVRRFDVTGTVGKFLGTKQGLNFLFDCYAIEYHYITGIHTLTTFRGLLVLEKRKLRAFAFASVALH